MIIRIGTKTYRASQLEKAVVALAGATKRHHVSLDFYREGRWSATVDCFGYHGYSPSPFAALCALVSENAAEFKRFGVEVE